MFREGPVSTLQNQTCTVQGGATCRKMFADKLVLEEALSKEPPAGAPSGNEGACLSLCPVAGWRRWRIRGGWPWRRPEGLVPR